MQPLSLGSRGEGWKCLSFMSNGQDPYPEPHVWGELGHDWCGYYEEGISPRDERRYLCRSASEDN